MEDAARCEERVSQREVALGNLVQMPIEAQ